MNDKERIVELEAKCALLQAALEKKLDKQDQFEMIGTVHGYPLVLWNNAAWGGSNFRTAVAAAYDLFNESQLIRQLR